MQNAYRSAPGPPGRLFTGTGRNIDTHLLVIAVLLPELPDQSVLLPGYDVDDYDHERRGEQRVPCGEEDGDADAGEQTAQVLRVADDAVDTAGDDSLWPVRFRDGNAEVCNPSDTEPETRHQERQRDGDAYQRDR